MAQVVLLTATHYGSSYSAGDVVTVPDRVADRWVNSGIARRVEEDAPAGEKVDYTKFKATELQQMAREREIDNWDRMKKAELVTALNNYDAENLEVYGTPTANTTATFTATNDGTTENTVEAAPVTYEDLTVDELKGRAKDAGIEGYSSMRKAELIAALEENDNRRDNNGRE